MLTSLYYYDHYRPYIVNQGEKKAMETRKLKKSAAAKEPEPTEVALNKALNSEIVRYAKSIYKNTTDLKYTSKKIAADLKNYLKYKDRAEFDQEDFERVFDGDLERFASAYNKSVSFLKTQPHSARLGANAGKIEAVASSSGKIMGAMGMTTDEDGSISVGTSKDVFWNGRNTETKIEQAEGFFSKMHEQASEILGTPMSKHMNFKSLNYYYNYEVDKVRVDSFQIIKTGLLVNLAL